jgi:hypothetical protein
VLPRYALLTQKYPAELVARSAAKQKCQKVSPLNPGGQMTREVLDKWKPKYEEAKKSKLLSLSLNRLRAAARAASKSRLAKLRSGRAKVKK